MSPSTRSASAAGAGNAAGRGRGRPPAATIPPTSPETVEVSMGYWVLVLAGRMGKGVVMPAEWLASSKRGVQGLVPCCSHWLRIDTQPEPTNCSISHLSLAIGLFRP